MNTGYQSGTGRGHNSTQYLRHPGPISPTDTMEFPYCVLINCDCSYSDRKTTPAYQVQHFTEPLRARVRELGGDDQRPIYVARNLEEVHAFVRGAFFTAELREHLGFFMPAYTHDVYRVVDYPCRYAVRITFTNALPDWVYLCRVWRSALDRPEQGSLLARLSLEVRQVIGGFVSLDL